MVLLSRIFSGWVHKTSLNDLFTTPEAGHSRGTYRTPTHIELPGSERVAVLLWVHMRALTGGVQNE